MLDRADCVPRYFLCSSRRIIKSPAMTAKYVAPLMAKHQPSPTVATRNPAITGARELALLKIEELSATAFRRLSQSTISDTKAYLVGTPMALMITCSPATARICHNWTCPNSVRAARMKASSIEDVWVATTTHRRRYRSAMSPPMGARNSNGACPMKTTSPSWNEEPVRRYTSQACATDCSQLPSTETICPKKYRR